MPERIPDDLNADSRYKVKLNNGRILGPLSLSRVVKLINKGAIQGDELARTLPDGDWKPITQHSELADLLIEKLGKGKLTLIPTRAAVTRGGQSGNDQGDDDPLGTTVILSPEELAREPTEFIKTKNQRTNLSGLEKTKISTQRTQASDISTLVDSGEDRDPTIIGSEELRRRAGSDNTTRMMRTEGSGAMDQFGQFKDKFLKSKKTRGIIVAGVLLLVLSEIFFSDKPSSSGIGLKTIQVTMPTFEAGKANPAESQKAFDNALKFYLFDQVETYIQAAQGFSRAASLDSSNVKALALLASSYISLIDSATRDENFFSIVSKLIDMARAKDVELPETVIAEVEFFLAVGNSNAAEKRLLDYLKKHQFGYEMYYYLAATYFDQNNLSDASRFLNQIPDDKVFSPKVFHLKGKIAERFETWDEALNHYKKAIAFPFSGKSHARSYLGLARVMDRKGLLPNAGDALEQVIGHPQWVNAKELAEAYFYRSKLHSLSKKTTAALGDIKEAVKLNRLNEDYILAYYQLRAESGESVQSLRGEARMFFFLGEGEKALIRGQPQEAQEFFLKARDSDLKAILPVVRLGDAAVKMHDLITARMNYEKATEMAPNDPEVWSKLIRILVDSYEWTHAQEAIEQLRKIPGVEAQLARLSGDLFLRQKLFSEAAVQYRLSLSRGSIDPELYIAYGNILLESKKYDDAPLYFGLARRFDPLNMDALIGISKVIAAKESIPRAIEYLKAEILRLGNPRAEILAQIGELEISRGEWKNAQEAVTEALQVNPNYALPYRLQGKIYLRQSSADKKAIARALEFYKAYSDRNPADPSGYLDRHEIFISMSDFTKALDELDRVFSLFPKFPNHHFYRGRVYALMGNQVEALKELEIELSNHPTNVSAMIFYGRELLKLEEISRALEQFNKAMQLVPSAAEPKHLAGYANYLSKNYLGAVALYRAALEFDRGNPLIYKRLGAALEALGKRKEAGEAYRTYLQLAPDAPDREQYLKYE